MHRPVLHLIVLAGTTGHHDNVRMRYVGEPRSGGQDEASFLVADMTGPFGHEDHFRAR